MATIADLNIRLGLLSKQFERDLRGMERRLQRSGERLSRLGNDLTLAVTTPLAGIGYAAIKSAGDIEALRLALNSTMEDAGRSTEEATAELEALRKAALAPGLDFGQAVKASVRLQSVGFEAEKARSTIVELANAVALTGGTAEDLSEVTNQFSQMVGKGKLFQDDIKIILGRMPKLASIMKETFGTTTAEGINDLGIDARTFIETVTREMQKLPRVSGGIKNALVNVFTGLQLEAARLGDEINKAFNIGDATETILSAVRAVVDAFAGLSDGSKKIIVSLAGLAAAAGPVTFALGKITSLFAVFKTGILTATNAISLLNTRVAVFKTFQESIQKGAAAANAAGTATQGLTAAFSANTAAAETSRRAGRELSKALKNTGNVTAATAQNFTGVTAVVQRATAAFKALSAAQKLALLGGVVAAVAAAVIVFNEFTRELNNTEQAQRDLLDIQKEANAAVAREKSNIDILIATINSEVASRSQKLAAFEKLKQAAPDYFGQLKEENGLIVGLDEAYQKYIKSVEASARAAAAREKLVDIEKQLLDLEDERIDKIKESTYATKLFGGSVEKALKFEEEQYQKSKTALEARRDAMLKNVVANETAAASSKKLGDNEQDAAEKARLAAERAAAAKEVAAKKAELYKKALASIQAVADKGDVLGADVISEQAKEIENQIERLLENGFKPYSREVQHLRDMLKGLFDDIRVPQLEVGVSALPTIALPDQGLSIRAEVKGKEEIDALSEAAAKGTERAKELALYWESAGQIMKRLGEGTTTFSEALTEAYALLDKYGMGLQSTFLSVAEAMGAAFAEAKGGFGEMALAAVAAGAKIIKVQIQEGVAAAVSSALKTIPFPFNLAAGAIAGGAAAALFSKAISSIGVPALAEGGVVNKPTLALIGEYPGAATDPEIVAPESKLRKIFESGDGATGKLIATVKGDDLQFVLDRAGTRRGRTR